MKKNFWSVVLLIGLGLIAHAEERITVSVGDTTTITLPFVIEKFQLSIPDLATIKSLSDTQLSIIGKKQGEGKLDVVGGGVTQKYILVIAGNTSKILSRLRNDLQDIPEISVSMNQNIIVLRGNISKYEKWKSFQEIVAYYKGEKIQNFVRFVPSAETILSLKKELENMGYTFSDAKDPEPGCLSMRLSPNAFFLSGKVFSENEKKDIMALLKSQAWLSLAGAKKDTIPGFVNITVVQSQIAVDIAFIALNKNDADSLGSNGTLQGTVNFAAIYDIIAGRATGESAQFGGDMNRTIAFLASKGISRIHRAGTVTFTNSSPDGGYLKVGGTRYIKVLDDVKDVSYGLTLTVKGNLLTKNKINLTLNLENSAMDSDVDKKEQSIRTSRIAEINKTAIVGGYKDITHAITNSGLPILRNTPVLQWFVGSKTGKDSEENLLVLACPRICSTNEKVQMTISLTDEVAPIAADAKKSNKEYENSQKKYSGWLFWMNWFCW